MQIPGGAQQVWPPGHWALAEQAVQVCRAQTGVGLAHNAQASPPVPHAPLPVPARHSPFAQQPLQHSPPQQRDPAGQLVQAWPAVPHAWSAVPGWH